MDARFDKDGNRLPHMATAAAAVSAPKSHAAGSGCFLLCAVVSAAWSHGCGRRPALRITFRSVGYGELVLGRLLRLGLRAIPVLEYDAQPVLGGR